MSNVSAESFELPENAGVVYQQIDRTLVDSFPKLYIFSIDTNPHIVSKGGYGEFVIPAKQPGERVSKPLVIAGRYPSHMHLGGQFSPVHYEDGRLVARDIVGIDSQDKGLGRFTSNLEWHGVFVTANIKPTDKEIQGAEEKRRQYLERLVADADAKFMRGKTAEIDAPERAASHELNLKKSWADKPTSMDQCPACGSAVHANIAVCPNCNAVLQEELARHFFPERFPKPEAVVAKKI